ncbi:MAG TPA: IS701 family transposase, partial [Methanospirillum sp.]|nr:IS701 family transposase [Methanospirillum sp.]
QAIEAKIKFSFVAMDGFYGKQPWLLTRIEKKGVTYVADIGCKDRVIIEKPEYGLPPKKGILGSNPSIIKVLNTIPVSVEEIKKTIVRWRTIRIRESTEGFLEVKFTALRVWRIDKDVHEPIAVWLLIRKDLDDSNVKYSLCNASPIQTWSKLARMQSERYWIERSVQDAIDLAGMEDYQVRNWDAWHNHLIVPEMHDESFI